MAVLKVRYLGDPVLRTKGEPVLKVTEEMRTLAADMFETMYALGGVGLAAPQIGISKRLIVLDGDTENYGQKRIVVVNPAIVEQSGTIAAEEGCLSVPEIREVVERSARVVLTGIDLEGEEIEVKGTGILARAIQHEIDHIEGLLFIDRVGPLKRDLLLKQWEKIRREQLPGRRP